MANPLVDVAGAADGHPPGVASTCWVQPVPSQNRRAPVPPGSGYQPGGGVAEDAGGPASGG